MGSAIQPMTELAASAKEGPTPMRMPYLSQGALMVFITLLAACPARAQHRAAAGHARGPTSRRLIGATQPRCPR